MTAKTALVAGATGAAAKRLVEVLLEGGWQVIGLSRHALRDVALWDFADFYRGLDCDNVAERTRIRLHGFRGVADTGAQILAHLQRYREARLLP